MTSSAVRLRGFGTAGKAFLSQFVSRPMPREFSIEVADSGVWKDYHVLAGLIGEEYLNMAKAESARRILIGIGHAPHCIRTSTDDVRDDPRSFYAKGITVAATDSHDTKNQCVMYSLQAGSPAVSIGLGPGEAVVECYSPSQRAGYCCVHGTDKSWLQRQPCALPPTQHTTDLAWRRSRETVVAAGALAASIVANYQLRDEFPAGMGACLRNGKIEWFRFSRESGCEGYHDSPIRDKVVHVAYRPEKQPIDKLLETAGSGVCYADRVLAWRWRCSRCSTIERGLHTVHPGVRCTRCHRVMEADRAQATGLSGAELAELNGGMAPTLADLGLGAEKLIRCVQDNSKVIWIVREDS